MVEDDFEISTQPSPGKKSTRKKSSKSKKALDLYESIRKGEKEKMVMPQEEWGDSIQELHLEGISKNLNRINLNLGKISNNFVSTNEHLSWVAFAVKFGLFVLALQVALASIFLIFIIAGI